MANTIGAYGWLRPRNVAAGYEGLDYSQYFLQMRQRNILRRKTGHRRGKASTDVVANLGAAGGRHISNSAERPARLVGVCRATRDGWDAVQVVTWHDYEESPRSKRHRQLSPITAVVNGSILSWSVPDDHA